ncbi:nucleic acid-binding protein [Mycolicibacterium celeriflavum]|uniref:Ribonuclease VapC n=1 Tax=Mycolicibacterium celeriflavum TaxID=1249101 RepID=A0A1X0BN78_MYCCF|nr:type II toxin-antitoxin system VapC family toxin [Mycolicibacterium celeriflavum]MCV7239954.1 type II toxin-antitoxin system VapC family toxin [Mycolicibacterium celeriflavum]OBG14893.1 nucleic acid-binding protein [Mycolicibacterium celeriflavum]ORA44001.1 VapC toxin family PIN domain ribonuclease [Mycolicibacterium celeriflavum]BBY42759.1 ribonuclease VapC46 [Mycolicibacterium celeriflavum]
MNIYLDSSALVKLVIEESDSPAVAQYLADFPQDNRVTAAITRTELLRAVSRRGAAVENARSALTRINFVALTTNLLDTAAALTPPELRTLDAIHLAAALTTPELRAVVTYDRRLADAANRAGVTVASPTQSR